MQDTICLLKNHYQHAFLSKQKKSHPSGQLFTLKTLNFENNQFFNISFANIISSCEIVCWRPL